MEPPVLLDGPEDVGRGQRPELDGHETRTEELPWVPGPDGLGRTDSRGTKGPGPDSATVRVCGVLGSRNSQTPEALGPRRDFWVLDRAPRILRRDPGSPVWITPRSLGQDGPGGTSQTLWSGSHWVWVSGKRS